MMTTVTFLIYNNLLKNWFRSCYQLPAIMAPCLLGKKVNSENLKKTIMEKEFTFKQETIELFQELVEKKIIKINGIKDLQTKIY